MKHKELIDQVAGMIKTGAKEEWDDAFFTVSKQSGVSIEDLEYYYDIDYRDYLASRGIDP